MRKILVLLILLFCAVPTDAIHITNDNNSNITYFVFRDKTAGTVDTGVTVTNIDCYYIEDGALISAKFDVTAHANGDDAFDDEEGFHMGYGVYRIDFPDVAFDGGVGTRVQLIAIDGDGGAFTEVMEVELSATAGGVWDEPLTGSSHNISTSAGKRLRQIEEAFVHASGTIATVTNGHTFTLDAGAVATADYYIGDRLQLVEGTGAGQSRLIVSYTSGKVVTLDSNFITNPNTSTLYEINAADVHVSISDADQAQGFVATYTDTTTITLDAAAVATTDYYKGSLIVFTHGTGAGQVREITGYTNGRVVTMSPALATALDTTTVWHVQAAVSAAEIVDEVWAKAMTDLAAGAPSATASVFTAINYLYEAWRNGYKTDGTNSEIVLYKDDGTTPLVEADIADDGTDFTRQEYGAPD